MQIMAGVIQELSLKLETFNKRINIFNAVLKRDKLPSYLMPGEMLLGKY